MYDECSTNTCSNPYYYRPQRSWAKVIFSQACVMNSVHKGGRGYGPGGVCSKFLGGGLLQFFLGGSGPGGVSAPNFRGGSEIFFSFKFLSPKKNSPGMHTHPPTRSMRGRNASYWNAFL